jgi:hypothetical protein
MQRTKVITTEVGLATSAAGGLTVSDATCVRLYNGAGGVATVSIASTVGAGDTATITMPQETVEFLEKPASYVVWASSTSVKAAKVGLTN